MGGLRLISLAPYEQRAPTGKAIASTTEQVVKKRIEYMKFIKSHSRDIRKRYHEMLKSYEWICYSNNIIGQRGCCWQCASEQDLQVHHMIYRDIAPWEYEPHEVRVLCKSCHALIHSLADDIWVSLLVFEPHKLESILTRLRQERLEEYLRRVPYEFIEDIPEWNAA